MKKHFLLPILLLMSSCQQVYWQMYKQEALKEGYVPIPPRELFPDNPEQGYLDDGVPYLAGNIMKEQSRTSYLQLMQQAAQVQLTRVHQTGGCWSIETAETELPAVPVNDEFCEMYYVHFKLTCPGEQLEQEQAQQRLAENSQSGEELLRLYIAHRTPMKKDSLLESTLADIVNYASAE